MNKVTIALHRILKNVTKDTIRRDFNPWLIQTELDIQKRTL